MCRFVFYRYPGCGHYYDAVLEPCAGVAAAVEADKQMMSESCPNRYVVSCVTLCYGGLGALCSACVRDRWRRIHDTITEIDSYLNDSVEQPGSVLQTMIAGAEHKLGETLAKIEQRLQEPKRAHTRFQGRRPEGEYREWMSNEGIEDVSGTKRQTPCPLRRGLE